MAATSFDASKYLTNLRGKEYLEVKWRLLWLRTQHPDATIETEMVEHDAGLALFRARVSVPEGGSATGWGSETVDDFGDFIEKAETKALGRALAALGFGTQFCEDFNFSGANASSSSADADSNSAGAPSARDTHARHGGADANPSGADAALPRGTRIVDAPVAKGRLKAVRDAEGAPPAEAGISNSANANPSSADAALPRGTHAPGSDRQSATSSQINAILAIARERHALGEASVEERCRATYGCPPGEMSKQQASEFIVQLRRPGERPGEQIDTKQARRRQRQPA